MRAVRLRAREEAQPCGERSGESDALGTGAGSTHLARKGFLLACSAISHGVFAVTAAFGTATAFCRLLLADEGSKICLS